MKLLESKKELEEWETYRTYMKESLKLVDGQVPCFISKDKLEFKIDGKPWKGARLPGRQAGRDVDQEVQEGRTDLP